MTVYSGFGSLVVFALSTTLVTSCATEKQATSWEKSGHSETRTLKKDPAREAAAAFTDDACVAEAERHLDRKPKYAKAMMLGCMRRGDFMLIARFAEPEWKGIEVGRGDWDALIAAYLRRGSADSVDLSPVGVRARSLVAALEEDTPRKGLHLVHAMVVTSDDKGVLVRPIVYESTDRTVRKEETYDIVDSQGTLVEKDVNVVREEKSGTSRVSQTLEERVWIAIPGDHAPKKGQTWVLLVDKVVAAKPGSDAKAPALQARLVAGAPVSE